ncbi:2-phosphosulfolactate phosphatase [Desulforamulus ruminis]|uniref:Probable 2-phosphosulfolactate phosphatase n=1 Tax=Desulforamulus ruminis (strain ATCC 23193 / DSM 2154 / NCIMB 8452 / DL) TaxID=696281 RepID=F6DQV4_DESRL|nr:2-phosphosulfolactate phosphatase [Desulforamulus ruminis]AEG58678.1 2-phosphosulfolactate phosphatase [Desulforamulus ruminis DSM 2154]
MKIDIAYLPGDIKQGNLSNTVCIVLDIFRATTTIVTSISNGCRTIIPVLSTEEARDLADRIGPALFAGERQSIKIDGFDFGNSPFEFSREKVKDQTIIMTTTNGTTAIKATEGAKCTLIGSFLNANAVCQKALKHGKNILIVCAGTDGLLSLEDTLCAGFLVDILSEQPDEVIHLSDSARGALLMYTAVKDRLLQTVIKSRNGERLYNLNRLDDISYCLQSNKLKIVPEYVKGRIKLS